MSQILNKFRKDGFTGMTDPEIQSLLEEASQTYYYSATPILTDTEYDQLADYFYSKNPHIQQPIGANATTNTKVKANLPYFMGSMNKFKPGGGDIENWKKTYTGNEYVVSCKLDGISGLFVGPTAISPQPKLYTRGTGEIGMDVSYLIPFINGIPQTQTQQPLVVRGEFVIKKSVFQEKYVAIFANTRNMVAGIFNQKNVDTQKGAPIYDIDFVIYEVIEPPNLKPSEQFQLLKNMLPKQNKQNKLNIVWNQIISRGNLTEKKLAELFQQKRGGEYEYDIDGLVVYDNNRVYERKTENPKHAFAFKMPLSDQIADVRVVDVIWTASKDGYLKPRVQIEPIQLCGVQIEWATGFNAGFIVSQKIGTGAVIRIIRSGDVIPYIQSVVMASPLNELQLLPNPNLIGRYHWNTTHVDIILDDLNENIEVRKKTITKFFETLQVEGLSEGNVSRIITDPIKKWDSISKILQMTEADYLKIEGFQAKMAKKICEGIKTAIMKATLEDLMVASNLFGRGFSHKKIELIMQHQPDILVSATNRDTKIQQLLNIQGIALISATDFVNKIPDFLEFLQETNLTHKLQTATSSTSTSATSTSTSTLEQQHELYGKTIVMTGFRNKQIEEQAKKYGIKMGDKVSKTTALLIIKEHSDDAHQTSKYKDATKNNISILSLMEFTDKYPELVR